MRKTYSQQAVEARFGRTVAEILQDLYVERGYSDREIAEALGVTRQLVNTWRLALGLARPTVKAALAEDAA